MPDFDELLDELEEFEEMEPLPAPEPLPQPIEWGRRDMNWVANIAHVDAGRMQMQPIRLENEVLKYRAIYDSYIKQNYKNTKSPSPPKEHSPLCVYITDDGGHFAFNNEAGEQQGPFSTRSAAEAALELFLDKLIEEEIE